MSASSSIQRRIVTTLNDAELIAKFKDYAKNFKSESEAAQQLIRDYYDNLSEYELKIITKHLE